MNKRISIGVAISLIAIAAAVTFILTSSLTLRSFNEKITEVEDMAENYERLDALDANVREYFYEDIDEDTLMNGILKGYVSGLQDPYARYMTAEEYKSSKESDKGILSGIGITVSQEESGYIRIVEITSDTPAADSDLAVGDIIVAVDGKDVLETGYNQAIANIRGTDGSSVTLTIRRNGTDVEYPFERQSIELTSAFGEMLDHNIGYLRLTAFKEVTVNQYQTALDSLISQGAKAIIFDVRDNGGGLISSVEACLDPLLPESDVAYATYKDGVTKTIVSSDEKELKLPMAVLVNGNTASSAELFASALRDFDKGKLYGTTTFGKGIMQNTIPLEDGGGLTVTVATYRTIHSECYHGVGLTPDTVVDLPEDSPAVSELSHADDAQLQKAIVALTQENTDKTENNP